MNATTILFKRNTLFLGRNGRWNARGIDICCPSRDIVLLRPITTKGDVGRCEIEIPVEHLMQVVDALTDDKLALACKLSRRRK